MPDDACDGVSVALIWRVSPGVLDCPKEGSSYYQLSMPNNFYDRQIFYVGYNSPFTLYQDCTDLLYCNLVDMYYNTVP